MRGNGVLVGVAVGVAEGTGITVGCGVLDEGGVYVGASVGNGCVPMAGR